VCRGPPLCPPPRAAPVTSQGTMASCGALRRTPASSPLPALSEWGMLWVHPGFSLRALPEPLPREPWEGPESENVCERLWAIFWYKG